MEFRFKIQQYQADAVSMKEGGRSKESRIIYSKRDEFGRRRPADGKPRESLSRCPAGAGRFLNPRENQRPRP